MSETFELLSFRPNLFVRDVEKASAFYRDVLGLEFYSTVEGRHCFFQCGDQMFLLFDSRETTKPSDSPIPTHGTSGQGHVCFVMTRDEIQDWRSQLADHDVEIEVEYEWPGGGISIYFRDPSGNSIELATPDLWKIG